MLKEELVKRLERSNETLVEKNADLIQQVERLKPAAEKLMLCEQQYRDLKEQDEKLTKHYEDKIALLTEEWKETQLRYVKTIRTLNNRIRRLKSKK